MFFWLTQILEFSPRKLGKMNPFWRAYFSDGLVHFRKNPVHGDPAKASKFGVIVNVAVSGNYQGTSYAFL